MTNNKFHDSLVELLDKFPEYVSASFSTAFFIWLAIPGDCGYFRIVAGVLGGFLFIQVVRDLWKEE